MSGEAFVLGLLALLTLLLSVVVWNVFATARTRAASGHDREACERVAREVERLRADVEQLRRERGTEGRP